MAARLDPQESNVSNEAIAAIAIEVDQAQREIDEATGRKRSILKRAKSQGIKNDILLSVIAMKKQDEIDVQAKLRDTLRYARVIVPHIKLTQADLFGGLDERPLNAKTQGAVKDWEAEQKGYENGMAGGTMDDCVYAPGTEARVHYQRGYVRGQTVIADRMGDNAKKADPSLVKRRGGKKAAAGDDTEQAADPDNPPFAGGTVFGNA